jgi:hypothetical protein
MIPKCTQSIDTYNTMHKFRYSLHKKEGYLPSLYCV